MVIDQGEVSLMPIPMKACDGLYSAETIRRLVSNLNRAEWHPHPCSVCGAEVTAHLYLGNWVPDAHWPSIPRRASDRSVVAGYVRNW